MPLGRPAGPGNVRDHRDFAVLVITVGGFWIRNPPTARIGIGEPSRTTADSVLVPEWEEMKFLGGGAGTTKKGVGQLKSRNGFQIGIGS